MSSLTRHLAGRATRNVSTSHALAATTTSRRGFQSYQALKVSKESDLHKEDRAHEAEHHKQDQLRKQKEGKGHWTPELASDSESIVKADRNDLKDMKSTISELQQESARVAQEKHKGK